MVCEAPCSGRGGYVLVARLLTLSTTGLSIQGAQRQGLGGTVREATWGVKHWNAFYNA